MSETLIIPSGKIINDYQVIDLIGVGSYGGIYKVKDTKSNQIYAMKTEVVNSQKKSLQTEMQIMKQLNGDFFPKLRDNGNNKEYNINYIIMDIYGASINTIQLYNKKHLPASTVYNICYQMLQIIQIFHSNGFVHRDIKPSNFLIQNKKNFPIILIDFGISQKHIDPITNKPYPFKKDKVFSGTTKYTSIDVCKGYSHGRKDDLISWFYSFLDLYCGFLPWDKSNISDMLLMKKYLKISSLNPKFPKEITSLYKYIEKLKYDRTPNYAHIRQLFIKCMEKEKVQISQFNWSSFYLKHSNLEVLTKELSLKQLRINSQKENNGK